MDDEFLFGGAERRAESPVDPWYSLVELHAAQTLCPVVPAPRTSPENRG
ncbi:hypothetical protein [Prauserella cavernicola]|uniref:Uncharacterized protein n=1 Tax=Prauserella cavernicola TaxID=2800127 RepID=A0A934R074_9PSEU|nr:hypothetical protein [Prauserella cavernicola]MBK1789287.1 hypothetical protein [Prauserella cavernicola]